MSFGNCGQKVLGISAKNFDFWEFQPKILTIIHFWLNFKNREYDDCWLKSCRLYKPPGLKKTSKVQFLLLSPIFSFFQNKTNRLTFSNLIAIPTDSGLPAWQSEKKGSNWTSKVTEGIVLLILTNNCGWQARVWGCLISIPLSRVRFPNPLDLRKKPWQFDTQNLN